MNEHEREQIIALTTDWHLKREVVIALQIMHTSADGEVRLKQAIDYELACVEERRARLALERAKDALISAAVAPSPAGEKT